MMILQSLARRAAFLHERQSLPERLNDETLAVAQARLNEWRRSALLDAGVFAERLAAARLSESALLSMFVESQSPTTPDANRHEPQWLSLFGDVVAARRAEPSQSPPGPGDAAWHRFVAPFAEAGRRRLRATVSEPLRSLLGPGVEDALVSDLRHALAFEATRTLVLELNVVRMLGQLSGATSEERYAQFVSALSANPETWEALLDEYPVLARLLTARVTRWVEGTTDLLRRLADDQPAIERHLANGATLGHLAACRSASSDPHRGGRTVAILTFASGHKVVYKPKSLAVDVEFYRLVEWFNTTGAGCEHRTLHVLDRGAYGWVECVEHRTCETVDDVRRFYIRQGSLLALLHVLRATDMHFENVIAAGAYPVLVDLETLFHHPAPASENPTDRVLQAIQESVFSVGLLPVFALERGPASGVDFSALGGRRGQTFPHPTPVLEDAYRDTMRFVLKNGETAGADNRPSLGGNAIDASGYREAVVEGFVTAYARLVDDRGVIETFLDRFADVEVRHIIRPTFHYTFLLNAALHPDFLRDGLGREQAVNRLWSTGRTRPRFGDLVSYEREDLLASDVPIFTTRPGSRDLWSSRGERLADFFPQTSVEACKQRIARMGDRDCAGQVKLLRMSLQTLN